MQQGVSGLVNLAFNLGLQWLDQTAVKTVRAPDQTARFGTP